MSARNATLTRDQIVRAALALVDREGPGALSMRRLGAELGVDPMAAYHYLPNKQALLEAIVEAVMAEIDLTQDDPSAPAEERVLCAARVYRDALLAHANALPIVLSTAPNTPAAMRPVELLIGILRDGGLAPEQALAGMNAIAATVRGTVAMVADGQVGPPTPEEVKAFLERFPADEFPHLNETALCTTDFFERDFQFGIRALVQGLLASC